MESILSPHGILQLFVYVTDEINNFNIKSNTVYTKRLEKQRTLQLVGKFGHSSTNEAFISLLKFADKKKYNLPTQAQIRLTQKPPQEQAALSQINNFRQVDIRNMFKPKPVPSPTEIIEITDEDESVPYLNEIITGINNYIRNRNRIEFCNVCDNLFDCSLLVPQEDNKPSKKWTVPDFSIVENINNNDLQKYIDTFKPKALLNETEIFKQNMSVFLKELNAHNETVTNKNVSALNETLEFLKLTKIEDIFDDEIFSDDSNENVIKTPPKNKNLAMDNDVSPILASGRLKKLKSRLNSFKLSQVNSTPNSGNSFEKINEIKLNTFRPTSFNFNDFESSRSGNDTLRLNLNDDDFPEVFQNSSDNLNNLKSQTGSELQSNKLEEQNSVAYDDYEDHNMDLDFYLEHQKACRSTISFRETEAKNSVENKQINVSAISKDMFEESLEELKNINAMFDIADESLFDSSGSETDANLKNNLNKTVFKAKKDSDLVTTKKILENDAPENITKILEKEITVNEKDKNEKEKLCESMLQNEIIDAQTYNNSVKLSCVEGKNSEKNKSFSAVLNKTTILDNDNRNIDPKQEIMANESMNNSNLFDSDATIILSSDEEYKMAENNIILNKKSNNPSINNKSSVSLLSVTQMIDFMEESNLDESLKENKNPENITKTQNGKVLQENTVDISKHKHDFEQSLSVKKSSSQQILNNFNVADNIDDIWEDDSDFEVDARNVRLNTPRKSFTKIKNPLSVSQKPQNLNVSATKVPEISTFKENIVDVSRSAFKTHQKENTVNLNNTLFKNTITLDSDNEESLLKFSYSQKPKLMSQKKETQKLSQKKEETLLTQSSPIKFKRTVKRPIELSDSDDEFDTRSCKTQKNYRDNFKPHLKRFHSDSSCVTKSKEGRRERRNGEKVLLLQQSKKVK